MGRDHDGSSWCGAIGCSTYKKRNPELIFHRFPRDPTRCKQWVQNSRREDLRNKTVEYLHKNVFLCSRHFEPSQYHQKSKRLLCTALPTIFEVPNPPAPATLKRPLRERQEPPQKKQREHLTPQLDWSFVDSLLLPKTGAAPLDGSAGVDRPENDRNAEDVVTIPDCDNIENQAPAPASTPKRKTKRDVSSNRYRCAINRLKRSNAKLRERIREQSRVKSVQEVLRFTAGILSAPQQSFLQSQLQLATVKTKGRRYSDKHIMDALAIYYQGPKAYRHLRKKFILPSPRCLRKRIEKIQMRPGFQDWIIAVMKEKFKNASQQEKLIAVSFDEMQVRPKLTYLANDDVVEGFENFGELGRTSQQADHALVFMARGVTAQWKQPVGYMLSKGPTPARVLQPLLVSCIQKLRQAGFTVVCTVCDMGSPNQEMWRKLGVNAEHPSFMVDDEEVACLQDVPHLFKCLRNTLLGQDIVVDGMTSSWNHIRIFYEKDTKRRIRCAPKLTKKHISPGAFQKMKVRLATQVLSHTVAAGISLYNTFGDEDCGAEATAELLRRLNDTFDVLNSCSPKDPNEMKRALTPGNIAERRKFLEETSSWLGRWNVKVPSVRGLQQTIAGVLAIWDKFGGNPLDFLLTRRLNQDGLENLFGVIRMRNGQNDAPDPTQFRMALRQSTATRLLVPGTANCEPDGDSLLSALTSVAQRVCATPSVVKVTEPESGPQDSLPVKPVDPIQANILTYVAGYLLRKGSEKHTCDLCLLNLLKPGKLVVYEREIFCGLKSFTGLTETEVGSLLTPTQAFYDVVVMVYGVVEAMAPSHISQSGILAQIMQYVVATGVVSELINTLCPKNAMRFMLELFVRLQIYQLCKMLTRNRSVVKQNRKLLKVSSRT